MLERTLETYCQDCFFVIFRNCYFVVPTVALQVNLVRASFQNFFCHVFLVSKEVAISSSSSHKFQCENYLIGMHCPCLLVLCRRFYWCDILITAGMQMGYNANKLSKIVRKREKAKNWLVYFQLKHARNTSTRPTTKVPSLELTASIKQMP